MKTIKSAINFFSKILVLLVLTSCGVLRSALPEPTSTAGLPSPAVTSEPIRATEAGTADPVVLPAFTQLQPSPTALEEIRFAVIGDYGEGN